MKIVLLGYMASGKTTVGKFLSARMYIPFIDLDEYIVQKEQKTISEIFKEEGEISFRLKEHQYLKELLAKKEDFILSLGGGTPCYANNMEVITTSTQTVSIYLQASIKTIVNRLLENRKKRPLVADLSNENLTEFVAKHLFERAFFYEQATFKINSNNKAISEIVTEIRVLLH